MKYKSVGKSLVRILNGYFIVLGTLVSTNMHNNRQIFSTGMILNSLIMHKM